MTAECSAVSAAAGVPRYALVQDSRTHFTELAPNWSLCRRTACRPFTGRLAAIVARALFTRNTLLLVVHHRRIISCMKLKQSNPYLKSAADRKATLRISAETSSAVEGIRAPFAKGRGTKTPTSKKAFIAQWKRRVASSVR